MPKLTSDKYNDRATSRWMNLKATNATWMKHGSHKSARAWGVLLSDLCISPSQGPQPINDPTFQSAGNLAKPMNLTKVNLQTTLNWDPSIYMDIRDNIHEAAKKLLDLSLPLRKQNQALVEELRNEMRLKHSLLTIYEDDWVTLDFLRRFLKNTSSRVK